ncbi:MAG: anhydro-N-acetylmuramic acid kinase [Elusimicrobiota bacterium]|jgi:anhydro-N-acetylmuramic acid kinase|nr:anhydro-N-acetylmuramic acid kinase [Elusimicrobiota bacterium]
MRAQKNLAIGLMSGTSADGLTICLFDARAKKILHAKTYFYPRKLQNKILDAVNFKTPQLSMLNFELGRLYAKNTAAFIKEFKIDKSKVAVIGSHGQTVFHAPLAKIPNTLQTGEAAFLSHDTGLPVVWNFRPRDMAAGGSGAPLMPAFDDFLYGGGAARLLLNIGGISNITLAGRGIAAFGFDIGPGNVLIDTAVNILSKGRLNFDKGGLTAAKYEPDIKKARSLLRLFVKNKPPKSLDRNSYTNNFVLKYFPSLTGRDIATITYLTALIITQSIKKFILKKYRPEVLEISGGGVYNKTLTGFIAAQLKGIKVVSGGAVIDPLAKEAAAFAWFALQTLGGVPCDCRRATGAKTKALLGCIYMP